MGHDVAARRYYCATWCWVRHGGWVASSPWCECRKSADVEGEECANVEGEECADEECTVAEDEEGKGG
jgi:hypothetical protein